jgi:glycosyltransferase involved in cell wall biosynthesis
MLALESLIAISLAELSLWLPYAWKARGIIAPALIAALAAGSLWLIATDQAIWTILIMLVSLYRCFNLLRVAGGRIQADYLFHASRRTSLWLMGGQAAVAGMAALSRHYGLTPGLWWTIAAAAALACALIIAASTLRHLKTIRSSKPKRHFTDAELPALTVAIPARNETVDLEECLRSLVASTYPKLEIIVLDDCSQNKRTPEIIRGFAHGGVRFISGKEPPRSWLAKNYAYAQLADEANGDLLLFCGVDTRFAPGGLDALVGALLRNHDGMLSVLPVNSLPESQGPASWFMQPSRYAWELALPRQLIKRPPVLSTCWLITRQALQAAGGFEAVRRKGVPESYLARSAARAGGYDFLASDGAMGISSRKSPDEQRATAIRTRYLQLHRKPELAAFVGLAELGVLVGPLVLAAVSLLNGGWIAGGLAGAAFIIDCAVYSKLFNLTYRRFIARGIWLLPVAALYDIWLLNYSMWLYEFREVLWKGRNVCIPVMRVIPKLPDV